MIKAHKISFSTTNNIHSTPINAKTLVVLELVSPITQNSQRCRWVFSNQTVHQAMLLQGIWSNIVATLKSQHDGITGGNDGSKGNDYSSSNNGCPLPFLSHWAST